jgi:hypothetical protein
VSPHNLQDRPCLKGLGLDGIKVKVLGLGLVKYFKLF